jgi:adenosylmethionine-8-amino-7-oxononanoate aminotransferase
MTVAALEHDQKVLDKASTWVANYVGTVRPTITYIFVLELVAINIYMMYWVMSQPDLIKSMDDIKEFADVIFSSDEMAMLSGIIGYWMGTRSWGKK